LGYTPLESAALGVPAITSDLAGFGRYIKDKVPDGGIYVLERTDKSDEESITQFTQIMEDYVNLSQRERVDQKMIAKKISGLADWSVLAENYIIAHNMAIEKENNN
jgi:glycogen(starch) synthase